MRAGVRGVVLLFSALVTLPDLFAPVVAAEQSTQTQPVASKPVSLPAEYVIGTPQLPPASRTYYRLNHRSAREFDF
jgi:hypothetical protein